MVRQSTRRIALSIALVGIMAATLECAKLALAALPNVEAVTVLTALFAYSFGSIGIFAAVVFVCIEPIIWGFGTWMISYFIYWPLVALVFAILGKAKIKNLFLITGIAVLLTAFFGVLTSFVDVGLFSGSFDNLFYRFSIYYARGITFYLTQIITNAILFPLLFPIFSRVLSGVAKRMRIR